MKLLLISNSTNVGEPYLTYPMPYIKDFLGQKPLNAVFIPYAAVTFSYDEYELKVKERFEAIGHNITSVHKATDPIQAIENAEVINVVSSSVLYMIETLNLKAREVHIYPRLPYEKDLTPIKQFVNPNFILHENYV